MGKCNVVVSYVIKTSKYRYLNTRYRCRYWYTKYCMLFLCRSVRCRALKTISPLLLHHHRRQDEGSRRSRTDRPLSPLLAHWGRQQAFRSHSRHWATAPSRWPHRQQQWKVTDSFVWSLKLLFHVALSVDELRSAVIVRFNDTWRDLENVSSDMFCNMSDLVTFLHRNLANVS